MTEQDLIKAHGVKVGQIWVRDAPVPLSFYDMEVVYVTALFCVLHSTTKDVGLACIPSLAGIEGRYASPFRENIDRLKSHWKMIKDVPERGIKDKEILEAAIRIRATVNADGCPWLSENYTKIYGFEAKTRYLADLEMLSRQFLHEHNNDLPEE